MYKLLLYIFDLYILLAIYIGYFFNKKCKFLDVNAVRNDFFDGHFLT